MDHPLIHIIINVTRIRLKSVELAGLTDFSQNQSELDLRIRIVQFGTELSYSTELAGSGPVLCGLYLPKST